MPPFGHRFLVLDVTELTHNMTTWIQPKLGTIWLEQLGTPDQQESWQMLVANRQSTGVSQKCQGPWPQKSLPCPEDNIPWQKQKRQATELWLPSFVIQVQTLRATRATLTSCRAQGKASANSSCLTLLTSGSHHVEGCQGWTEDLSAGELTCFWQSSSNSSLLCYALFPLPVCPASIYSSEISSHLWVLKSCLRLDKFFPR